MSADDAVDQSQSVPAPVGVLAPPADTSAHTEVFARDSQEYVRSFLQLADQKAAFLFTAAGALLAVLYGSGAHKQFLVAVSGYGFTAVLALVSMAALTAAAGFAVWVVVPRESAGASGLFYWTRIRQFTSGREYAAVILALTPEEATRERLYNCRDLADICSRKYSSLRCAFASGVLGAGATLAYFLTTTS